MERFQSYKKHKTLGKVVLLSLGIIIVSGVVMICFISYRNTITPKGIIIHHSALPYAEVEPNKYLPLINEIHKNRGFGIFYWGHNYYIGYHYLILPDGSLEKGRPERCQGSHTRGYNSYIGICLIGDFSSNHNPNGELGLTYPTEAQMKTLLSLCHDVMGKYSIPTGQVFGHKELNPDTECPGDRFPWQEFLTKLKNN